MCYPISDPAIVSIDVKHGNVATDYYQKHLSIIDNMFHIPENLMNAFLI